MNHCEVYVYPANTHLSPHLRVVARGLDCASLRMTEHLVMPMRSSTLKRSKPQVSALHFARV
jgi:hypothetical protein